VGPKEWVYEESNKIGNMSFDFLEKSEPIMYVIGMARNMPSFNSPEDLSLILREKFISEQYKPELLSQVVDILADP